MIRRILGAVATAAIACGVAACNLDFGPFHRTTTICMIGCPYWRIEPSGAGILRGDTLRMSACWAGACGATEIWGVKGSDTGDVVSNWQLHSVGEFISLNDGLKSVSSATSVLVRALLLYVVGYKYASAVLRVRFLSVAQQLTLTVVQP